MFSSVKSGIARASKSQILKTYSKRESKFKTTEKIDNDYTDLIKKNVDKNSIVLDLGCGGGILTISISKFVEKIIAIDISKELIGFANVNNKRENVEYLMMDGEKLNFPENSFNVVVSHAVINKAMCKAEKALKSAYKILKPNGKIVLKMIYATWGKEFKFKGGYHEEEIREILENIGYKHIKIKIDRQKVEAKTEEEIAWLKDTEASDLSPKKEFERFWAYGKKKRKYEFDDSFMVVYGEKPIRR